MFAIWCSSPSIPSLFSHPSDSQDPWRVGFGEVAWCWCRSGGKPREVMVAAGGFFPANLDTDP